MILWITAEQENIASRVYQSQYVLISGSEIVMNIMKIDKIDKNIFMNNFGPLRLSWARKEVQKWGVVCQIRIETDQDVTI